MSLVDQGVYSKNTEPAGMRGAPQTQVIAVVSACGAVGGPGKRVADLVLASAALVVLSPIFLFAALMVRASGPGPILFGHSRIGLGGRDFRCLKFRTMCHDAEAVLQAHLARDPALAAEWQATRKLRHDPRVTRIGRVLRAYSIDELPQLLNVIRGEMSLVGPRPVVQSELARYGRAAVHYLSARPGITGLWQVSGRSDTSYETRVRLDSEYVTGWSAARDASIVLRTIPAVIGARGSC